MYLSFLPFQVSSFKKSDCLDFIAMMRGPNSSNLNPLEYQAWGQCRSLNKSCNRSQNQFL